MDSFINEDFLLTTHISRQLYHEIAENLPVIDFHNHLDPQKLAENGNKKFTESLHPGIENVLGIRIPALRRLSSPSIL